METFVQAHEASIRLGFFLAIFAIMAVWELRAPRRALTVSKAVRWVNNIGLVAFNTVLLRLLFPAAAVGMAAFATDQGWGLLHYFQTPAWLAIPIAVIAHGFCDLAAARHGACRPGAVAAAPGASRGSRL